MIWVDWAVVDWAIIAIVLLSAVLGLMRGMVRELIALGTWVAAILVARMFGPQVSEMLAPYIEYPKLQTGLGFVLTVIVVVVLGSFLSKITQKLISATGLGGLDRIMGFIFGGARGVAVLVLLVAMLSLTSLREADWWSASQFIPNLEGLRDQAMGLINDQLS